MAASEGAASLVVQTHSERLKEEQKRENQKKKEQELALAAKASEFSSGVKMGFANLPSAPVKPIKVIYLFHWTSNRKITKTLNCKIDWSSWRHEENIFAYWAWQ